MDLDPDDIFRDDEDDPESDFLLKEATKEFDVYLVDASPKMFSSTSLNADNKEESHFHIACSCISQSLKSQIINRSYDEVSICFFNTREKNNLQDSSGVFVFNVDERNQMDRPTARLIKEFDAIEESFMKDIGSQYGIVSGSRDNSLYNALWVAQALLRKGSAKLTDKRILLFTNEDDPFGGFKGTSKIDMTRTTLQRAKDAQEFGISIEVLPLCRAEEEFNFSMFYAELIGLSGDELAQIIPSTGQKMEDMKGQLLKRMFKKRIVRKINFAIASGLTIELNSYALVRPTLPGAVTWLDSFTNLPLKSNQTFICGDTGALLPESTKRIQTYKNERIMFSPEELSEIKRISIQNLRLLGFKPLSCLKDYYNLRPSTFLFPNEEDVIGGTRVFVALHRSMVRLKRFAVAFYGCSSHQQLVALVAQEEITGAGGQLDPPGMHMIYLPYSDDIRDIEELHSSSNVTVPSASEEQIRKAAALIKRVDLKKFSVFQFANPALQRHYAILQALALDEDEMPEIKDETVPDEEGMSRPGVVKTIEEFKLAVYGQNYEEIDDPGHGKESEASRKRKAIAENASKQYANYEWADLADNGKLKNLTVMELKIYLTAHNVPVSGNKEALINRILTHIGK